MEVLEVDPLRTQIGKFDAVITRAFSPQEKLENVLLRILSENGRFYYVSTSDTDLYLGKSFRLSQQFSKPRTDHILKLEEYIITAS